MADRARPRRHGAANLRAEADHLERVAERLERAGNPAGAGRAAEAAAHARRAADLIAPVEQGGDR